MFGLFKTVIIEDFKLGSLQRRGKTWHGKISLAGIEPVELELEGTKVAPFSQSVATAHELPSRYEALKPLIAHGLFEHLEPYQEALADPDDDLRDMYSDPRSASRVEKITTPEQALAAATLEGVEIGMEGQTVRLLIKFSTLWDEEHIVGAFFDDWVFQELNGSV